MRFVVAVLGLLLCVKSYAQKQESYDLLDYEMPSGDWTRSAGKDSVSYKLSSRRGYCILTLCKAAISMGSVDADAQTDWTTHVAKRFPNITNPKKSNWEVEGSKWTQVQYTGTVLKNKLSILVSQITFSGYGVRQTIIFENTDTSFDPYLLAFSSSMVIHPVQTIEPKNK